MRSHIVHAYCASALAIAVASTVSAQAQTAPAAGAPTDSAAGDTGSGTQEIVVTAEKRSESINRVGVTIAAFSGDLLKDRGIKTLADLGNFVPGLSVTTTAQGTPVYALRGVGYNDTALAATPDISIYVDEIPLPYPVLATKANLDLERVEILKGPQGVLFGENATGGAINFIAAKPTKTFQAGTDTSFGRFSTFTTEDYLSGPLASNLQGRVSFSANLGQGWQKSQTRDDILGKKDAFTGRLLLNWEPASWANFKLNVNGWSDKSDPQAPQNTVLNPEHPAVAPAAEVNAPIALANDRSADWAASPRPRGDESFYQTALRGEFNLGHDVTLTSLTSYEHFKQNNQVNEDGTDAQLQNYNIRGTISSVYQELRLSNGGSNRFRWIIGGNYEHSSVFDFNYDNYSGSSTAVALGIFQQDSYTNQKSTSYAGYVDGDYDITDKLTFKAGVRYTKTKRTTDACNADAGDGHVDGLFNFLSQLETGINPMLQPGQCIQLDAQGFPGRTLGKLSESNVPFRVGLDYKPNSDALFYVSVTRGYKAGVFPSLALANAAQNAPVPQESVLDYEGGLKVHLFGRKVLLTGAGFYYDYKDKQVQGDILDPIFGVLPILISVPKSHVLGGEGTLAWTVFTGMNVSVAGTYLDAKIDRYTGYNASGVVQNLDNTPLPFAAKWSGSLSADYTAPISTRLEGFVGGDVTARTRQTTVVGPRPIDNTNAYALVSLRAGIATQDGKLRFTVWGKNVGNKYYWTNTIRADENTIRYTGYPVSYGGTVNWKF